MIQFATDCFRLGRTINRFRRLFQLSTQSLSSEEDSEPTYNSINNSLSTNRSNDVLDEPSDDAAAIVNGGDDNLIFETNLNADKYRLCKAKAAHDAV